jgi:hypothetical protein
MNPNDTEVRALLDSRVDASRAKDIDRLMSLYSSDIVYYDVVPPFSSWDPPRFAATSCGGLMNTMAPSALKHISLPGDWLSQYGAKKPGEPALSRAEGN